MLELLKHLNEPQKVLLIVLFMACLTLGAWLKERLLAEFKEMKDTVRRVGGDMEQTTRGLQDRILSLQMSMNDLTGELAKIRAQIVTDAAGLLTKFEVVRGDMEKLEGSLRESAEAMEAQGAFIAKIRHDLEEMYGKVRRIEEARGGLEVSVGRHREMLDQVCRVLMAHGEKIKKVEGK